GSGTATSSEPFAVPGLQCTTPRQEALRAALRPGHELGGKLAHQAVEAGLAFESDARPVREREVAVRQLGIVGKAAEIAKNARIGFRPAEPEAGGDGQRHLVAAMRK